MQEFLTVAGYLAVAAILGGLAFVYFIRPRLPSHCSNCGWHGTRGERVRSNYTGWEYCPKCDEYFD